MITRNQRIDFITENYFQLKEILRYMINENGYEKSQMLILLFALVSIRNIFQRCLSVENNISMLYKSISYQRENSIYLVEFS